MKLKVLFMVLAFALASFAQTATPAAPSSSGATTCACCNPDQAGNAAKSGISAFAMKPVGRKELAETVRRVLDSQTVSTIGPCLTSPV